MLTNFPGNKEVWLARAGCHSTSSVPVTEDERLVFAVLEALDFECWKYGDAPDGITVEQAKQWLVDNKETIRNMSIEPPSYLGAMCGVYDFLNAPKEGV